MFHSKKKFFFVYSQKKLYLVIFRLDFEETVNIFEIWTREFFCIQSFMQKNLNFEKKSSIQVFIDWNWKNLLSYLKSTTSHFLKQSFVKKGKSLNLGLKLNCLGIFWLGFDNTIVIIEISTLKFVLLQCLGQQNSLSFLGWNFKIILWNSNSMASILSYRKHHQQTKMPKFKTVNPLLWWFGFKILKKCCHIWNQHPRFC